MQRDCVTRLSVTFGVIISTSLSISIASGAFMLQTCCLDHLSVCVSVRKVYCGKMAEWIRMPFEVVSGVGRGMGVLDGAWRW